MSVLKWIVGKIHRTRIARAEVGRLANITSEDRESLLYKIGDYHFPDLDEELYVCI